MRAAADEKEDHGPRPIPDRHSRGEALSSAVLIILSYRQIILSAAVNRQGLGAGWGWPEESERIGRGWVLDGPGCAGQNAIELLKRHHQFRLKLECPESLRPRLSLSLS